MLWFKSCDLLSTVGALLFTLLNFIKENLIGIKELIQQAQLDTKLYNLNYN